MSDIKQKDNFIDRDVFYYDNNSLKYVGETINGLYHGKGVYYKDDNQILVKKWEKGDFSDDVGAFASEIYEGYFKDGKPNGNGTLTITFYEREVKNHSISKNYRSATVHKYSGLWKDGNMVEGKYFYKGALKSEGQRDNLSLNGNGIEYFDRGEKLFEGQFLDNRYHGYGKLYYENGNYEYVGNWKDGYKNGQGKFYYLNGNANYEGNLKNSRKEGFGTTYYRNGKKKFVGEWKHNKKHGKGKLYNESGDIEQSGMWINDEYIGEGKFYFKLVKYHKKKFGLVFLIILGILYQLFSVIFFE